MVYYLQGTNDGLHLLKVWASEMLLCDCRSQKLWVAWCLMSQGCRWGVSVLEGFHWSISQCFCWSLLRSLPKTVDVTSLLYYCHLFRVLRALDLLYKLCNSLLVVPSQISFGCTEAKVGCCRPREPGAGLYWTICFPRCLNCLYQVEVLVLALFHLWAEVHKLNREKHISGLFCSLVVAAFQLQAVVRW